MKTNTVSVREVPGIGWEVNGMRFDGGPILPGQPDRYDTAAEAFGEIRKLATEIAEREGKSVVIIEWYPATRIGRMVVEALQE
jgi:hypothetical protein